MRNLTLFAIIFISVHVNSQVVNLAGKYRGLITKNELLNARGLKVDIGKITGFSVSANIRGYEVEARSGSEAFTAQQKQIIKKLFSGSKIYIEDIKVRQKDSIITKHHSLVFKIDGPNANLLFSNKEEHKKTALYLLKHPYIYAYPDFSSKDTSLLKVTSFKIKLSGWSNEKAYISNSNMLTPEMIQFIKNTYEDFMISDIKAVDENNKTFELRRLYINRDKIKEQTKNRLDSIKAISDILPSSISPSSVNSLMPKSLRIISDILFNEKPYNTDNYTPHKKEFQEKRLFQYIKEKIVSGEVKLYENRYNNTLYNLNTSEFSIKEAKKELDTLDVTKWIINKANPNGPLVKSIVKEDFGLDQIKGLVFIDEWYFDAEKFTFAKNVIAYQPIKSNNYERKKLICELNFEGLSKKQIKKSNKRLVHYAIVQYEQKILNRLEYKGLSENRFMYPPFENENAPFLTSYGRNMLIETIFNKVLKEGEAAYDFDSNKTISPKEIKKRMGATDELVMVEDVENPDEPMKEITVEGTYSLSEIKSYIFTEDWFLDPLTLRIVKKVRAIAPVRYYTQHLDGEQQIPKKQIVFEIKFE
ncbi:MAG: hypothetical protein B6I20_08645 [Bacteroidetes bacterium 4572_117]|nr:MAG: hypothetical protein B6I20_08645 [Bacteroidetes bacterium 4572_117]